MSELETLSGQRTYYPRLAEMTAGEVIFEKGKFVDTQPGRKFPNQTNYVFELEEPVVTDKGEFPRVALSVGQVAKAMENEEFGNYYKMTYQGKNVIEKGQWAGQEAHAVEVGRYKTDKPATTAAAPVETAPAKKTATKAKKTATKTTEEINESIDSLDDMMN